jgi:hypothetical protein
MFDEPFLRNLYQSLKKKQSSNAMRTKAKQHTVSLYAVSWVAPWW